MKALIKKKKAFEFADQLMFNETDQDSDFFQFDIS